MDTFLGRCMYYYNAINPMLCLLSEKQIAESRSLLEGFRNGTVVASSSSSQTIPAAAPTRVVSDEALWQAREVVESCVHPASGEVIPTPFRMAAFIPTNLFIVPFMMLPSTVASPTRTIFIHWFNQSYNAMINYSNRSSDAQPMNVLAQGYAAAVAVSVSGALGATFLMRKINANPSLSPFTGTLVRAVVPMLAVSFASSANCALMRRNEWQTDGVQVVDEDGVERGLSTDAGYNSLQKCAAARILWNIPCMMLPPLIAAPLAKVPGFAGRPIFTETMICVAGLGFGVAPALAFYPPKVSVPASSLEPRFHGLTRKNGEPVHMLTFYKGL
eukprot:CAMPEP_0176445888 /NCGR_PEP_ID=MMETSP0127-20121128/23985_1 /TAXON_ID=938130 /ORGANISM="Platyophrya macrostoma, Strain WH" /LENGTH=329 /DNA_ID=CAMNT_0017831791 /DNA_START=157 /DNA_END=1149 /DNA_ORIENTATION=+